MSEQPDAGYERLLVPIGDKSDPNMLTELSTLLVDPRHGTVRFVHVTTDRSFVKSQENWRTGSESVAASQHHLRRVGINSSGSIRTASSPVRGILDEAEGYEADAILIGWTDKESVSRLVGSLLNRANCDVLVFKAVTDPLKTKSILAPIVIPPDENRLRTIAILSQRADASVTFAYIAESREMESDGKRILEQSVARLEEYGVKAEPTLRTANDAVSELGHLSVDYDIMIIGTSRGWWLRQFLFGRKTDDIAEQAHCSVLMQKWQGEIPPEM